MLVRRPDRPQSGLNRPSMIPSPRNPSFEGWGPKL
jgi:hypothetical protein